MGTVYFHALGQPSNPLQFLNRWGGRRRKKHGKGRRVRREAKNGEGGFEKKSREMREELPLRAKQ
jgi:hypothetical protein